MFMYVDIDGNKCLLKDPREDLQPFTLPSSYTYVEENEDERTQRIKDKEIVKMNIQLEIEKQKLNAKSKSSSMATAINTDGNMTNDGNFMNTNNLDHIGINLDVEDEHAWDILMDDGWDDDIEIDKSWYVMLMEYYEFCVKLIHGTCGGIDDDGNKNGNAGDKMDGHDSQKHLLIPT